MVGFGLGGVFQPLQFMILGNFKDSLIRIFSNASVQVKHKICVFSGGFECVNHFLLIKWDKTTGEGFSEG